MLSTHGYKHVKVWAPKTCVLKSFQLSFKPPCDFARLSHGPPANNCFFSFGHKWQEISLQRFTCKQFNSEANLPAFFSALASPFFLRNSVAFSTLFSQAANALLQFIIPAPIASLSSLPLAADTARWKIQIHERLSSTFHTTF